MPLHFFHFVSIFRSPGVVLIRESTQISSAIDELTLLWSASTPDELANRLVWIPL